MLDHHYDVLIIGGSHAGLSAAMALGRMSRKAIVVDEGLPRNRFATHANNVAGLDGINPDKIRLYARADLEKYSSIEFYDGRVVEVEKHEGCFVARFSTEETVTIRKVILAYGIKDRLPKASGFKEFWGKYVYHCPFCHGYEVKGKRLGIVGQGPYVEHLLPMIKALSDHVTVFTNGASDTPATLLETLTLKGIPYFESNIASLQASDDQLQTVQLVTGERVAIEGIFVAAQLPFTLSSEIGRQLGCQKNDMGLYEVDDFGKTSVQGVYAAGDIMTKQQSVVGANATGQTAGAAVVFELVNEDFKDLSPLGFE